MRRSAGAWLFVLIGTGAGADEVYLKSGGQLSGIVVSRTSTSVEIEVGAGRVTVPLTLVERIETGESSLSQYLTRARGLSAEDSAGWLHLAEWARGVGLSSQARDAYQRVLRTDPANASAHRALGHQLVGEQWLNHDEAMQARGYVSFEGQWVAPAHRDTVLAEREADRRERAESERARLAVIEAEARAREAEARARAAELEVERAAEERDSFALGNGWGFPGSGPIYVVGPPTFGSPFFVQPCCNLVHAPGRCPRANIHVNTTVGFPLRSRRQTRRVETAPAKTAPATPPRGEVAVPRQR